MEKELLSLCERGDASKISQILAATSYKEIDKWIDNRLTKGKGDPTPLIKAILLGSKSDNSNGLERRMHVFKSSLRLLQTHDIHTKAAANWVGYLLLEVDALPPRCLADLASVYVDAIKTVCTNNGKYLELFPKILSTLSTVEIVPYQGNEMKGAEYKGHVLNSLCSARWETKTVIHLASMFLDIPLNPGELKFVIEKIIRIFPDVELEELPPLVFQLLLLSTKGHKQFILDGIITFFNQQDEKNKGRTQQEIESLDLWEADNTIEQIRQTQGTIILHITFAAKQDQEIGKEFLKILKAGQQSGVNKILSPFSLALALSLGRFDDQIFEHLKTAILKNYKEKEKHQESWWVREMVPQCADISESLMETVKNSTFGWDHVTQGLVQLGFLLMDSFGPKSAFGKTVEKPAPDALTPANHACDLGAQVLQETFKIHEVVRAEILEQILIKVVIPSTPVRHYLDLLAATVLAAPLICLETLPRIRETLDSLALLPSTTADGLLHALQPLLKISIGLRDSLIIILRKTLFSRQLESRKVAVGGYLLLLKHFRVLGGLPSSQMSSQSFSASQVDVHVPYNPASNEGLCLEILGNLRRCLSQQADIRMLLYEGLYEVLYRNSQLSQPILEMLRSQLMKYYEKAADVNPPLKLEPCITCQGDQVFITEPVAMLLNSVQLCVRRSRESLGDDELQPYEEILESLTQRMIKSEMEDFELDKSADFSRNSGVGIKNNIFALLVLGIYEALIEYNLMTGRMKSGSFEDVLGLFRNYKSLCEVLREKTGEKGRGGGGSASKMPQSLISIRCVAEILEETRMTQSTTVHPSNVKLVRDNPEFIKYLVSVAVQKLHQISNQGYCSGTSGHDQERLFGSTSVMAGVFLTEYTRICEGKEEEKAKRKLAPIYLEGLTISIKIACSYFMARLHEFLKELGDGETDEGEDIQGEDLIHHYVKKFQRLVMSVVSAEDDDKHMKDIISLLGIISNLSKHLPPTGTQFNQVVTWLVKLCTEQDIDDVSICKMLIGQLLTMTTRMKSVLSIIRDISLDCHYQLGDCDKGVEVEDESKFTIITPRSSATVLQLVLAKIERELDDTDWAITKTKGQLLLQTTPVEEVPTQREGHEKSICTRLGTLITAFHELVQSAMPPGPCSEAMLKCLTHFYAVSTSLVKYYQYVYSKSLGHFASRFEKLVKLSGTHLTPYAYAFVTYIQTSQNEVHQPNEKKGKKNEKKRGETTGKLRVIKEARFIPNLIFSIEQYEKYLIQLTKKSKVNLMEHMKLSTSRDFRINMTTLQTALDNQATSESEDEEVDQDADSGDENDNPEPEAEVPPAKKARLGGKKKAPLAQN